FDCKVPEDQPIIEKLPRISQFLDEPCRQHFDQVQAILKAVGVPFTLDDRLVRGLDYYTRTAFEFTHGALGAQNAILGGGRYDGLSEMLGGPAAPGIGFAIGEDRLVMALTESAEAVLRKPDVYIAPLGTSMNKEAARLARELRRIAWAVVVMCALLAAVSMQGQAPPPPAAELQKLDFMTGHWTAEGTATFGPPGTPSTKWSESSDAEWMDGKYFLVNHSDMD